MPITSNSSTISQQQQPSSQPLTRALYFLSDHQGHALIDLSPDCPIWATAPQEAVAHGMAWLSMTVAAEKLLLARDLIPGFEIHLGQLDLIQQCVGTWIPVGVRVLG